MPCSFSPIEQRSRAVFILTDNSGRNNMSYASGRLNQLLPERCLVRFLLFCVSTFYFALLHLIMRAEFAVPIAPASGTSSLILTNVIPRHGFSKTAPTINSLQPFFRRTSYVISKSKHRDVIYDVLNQLPNRSYAIFEPVHFFFSPKAYHCQPSRQPSLSL